jgi:hypothetical protein
VSTLLVVLAAAGFSCFILALLEPVLVRFAERVWLVWRFWFGRGGELRRLAVLDFKLRVLMVLATAVANYEGERARISERRCDASARVFSAEGMRR